MYMLVESLPVGALPAFVHKATVLDGPCSSHGLSCCWSHLTLVYQPISHMDPVLLYHGRQFVVCGGCFKRSGV